MPPEPPATQREIGEFSPSAAQVLLSLALEDRWAILEALQQLCDDPTLEGVQETHDGDEFIVVAGYQIGVEIYEDVIDVVTIRVFGSN